MKVLLVCDIWPFPEDKNGVTKVLVNLLDNDCEYELLTIEPPEGDPPDIINEVHTLSRSITSSQFSKLFYLFSNSPLQLLRKSLLYRELACKISEIESNYNLIHIYSPSCLEVGKHLGPMVLKKTFYSYIDSMSLFFHRRFDKELGVKKRLYKIESKRWRGLEKKILSQMGKVHLVSKSDENYLKKLEAGIELLTIENGVEPPKAALSRAAHNRLVFWGDLSYSPNESALEFIIEKLLPLLNEKIVLFGKKLPKKYENHPLVDYRGFVPRLSEELFTSDIFLCPLSFGTGIKNKVLEAFAFKVPVVASPIAVEGIACKSERDLLVCPKLDEHLWMKRIKRLREEPELQRKLTQSAYLLIKEMHSWEKKREVMKKHYKEIAHRSL